MVRVVRVVRWSSNSGERENDDDDDGWPGASINNSQETPFAQGPATHRLGPRIPTARPWWGLAG